MIIRGKIEMLEFTVAIQSFIGLSRPCS